MTAVEHEDEITTTLKSLIEEHAKLDFSDFFPPCSQIFSLLAYEIQNNFPPCSFFLSCLLSKLLPYIDHFDYDFAIKR